MNDAGLGVIGTLLKQIKNFWPKNILKVFYPKVILIMDYEEGKFVLIHKG
jgi:hypothetical protein